MNEGKRTRKWLAEARANLHDAHACLFESFEGRVPQATIEAAREKAYRATDALLAAVEGFADEVVRGSAQDAADAAAGRVGRQVGWSEWREALDVFWELVGYHPNVGRVVSTGLAAFISEDGKPDDEAEAMLALIPIASRVLRPEKNGAIQEAHERAARVPEGA